MATLPLRVRFPARADAPLVAAGPGRAAGLGLFLLSHLVDFARWQRVLSLWLRGAIVVLLVLALGRPEPGAADPRAVCRLRRGPQREHRRAGNQAIDDVSDQGGCRMPARTGSRCCRLHASRASFGPATRPLTAIKAAQASAPEERRWRPAQPRPEPEDATGLDRKGTDLAAALQVAAAAIPPFYVPRIVLLSDGNPTAGDALKAAAALQRQGRGAHVPVAGP